MKREFLKELGLEDTAIDKIMAENGSDIEKAKKGNKELEDKVALLESQIQEKDSKIDELAKSSDDAESLKVKIQELQEANKKQASDLAQAKIDSAVELALVNSKAKNLKAVRSLLDLNNAEIVDGKIKGLDSQIEKLKESDSYLFEVEVKPTIKGATPKDGGEPNNKPIEQMNYAELCAYMEANPGVELNK